MNEMKREMVAPRLPSSNIQDQVRAWKWMGRLKEHQTNIATFLFWKLRLFDGLVWRLGHKYICGHVKKYNQTGGSENKSVILSSIAGLDVHAFTAINRFDWACFEPLSYNVDFRNRLGARKRRHTNSAVLGYSSVALASSGWSHYVTVLKIDKRHA